MLGGEGSVVQTLAYQDHDHGQSVSDRPNQRAETNSVSSTTKDGFSALENLKGPTRQWDSGVVDDDEAELVEAEPLSQPTSFAPQAVLTSSTRFLPRNPRSFGDLYFDENRSLMKESAAGDLEEIAQILRGNSKATLFVDAHCDKRGAAAYSLMLGDRYAQYVQTYFMHLGLPPDRISPLSFGEAKVWCNERNAQCWESNLLLKQVFRLMAPNNPVNGCLIRLGLTPESYRFHSLSQNHRKSRLQRLSLAHSP